MEDIYKFIVGKDEFEKIVSGKKTYQLVLNSQKRRDYGVGNVITFLQNQDEQNSETKSVDAVIENLYYFDDIRDAVQSLGKEKCGFRPSETFENASDKFLQNEKFENVQKNGLVAIQFKINS